MRETRVLIADPNLSVAAELCRLLRERGCSCEVALGADSALSILGGLACQVAVCDTFMGGTRPFDLLDSIRACQPQLPVIVGGHPGSIVEAVDAIKRGAWQYVVNPYDIDKLIDEIDRAVAEPSSGLNSSFPPRRVPVAVPAELVLVSASMRELDESIELVARSKAPVLIFGETGTGKERVARAIHARGPRAHEPFVAVNTSAIPEPLLESEVFGHVRGAFTGAARARTGLLHEADRGTLLLDEIGDMPLLLQPKLLRVLQFGETRPLGSDRLGHVDVRIIAATHRDLSALVRDGRFREDLRYRLNVLPLFVPPLRERPEDIAPLVAQFLGEAQERTPLSAVCEIGESAMAVLLAARWAGNVRELENTIERLVVMGRKSVVTAADLGFLEPPPPSGAFPEFHGEPLSLKEMNKTYLDWVLVQTDGDKLRAAGILKIDLSTLYRWERSKR